jgi:DNA-binding winged helix-turn-helix (wHTH) protein/TolB-like protein/Flp pilus assembly protein TadD
MQQATHLYKFGSFRLNVEERRLLREGEPLALTPKAFDTLVMLVKRCGHVVKKEELLKEVWKDACVEEAIVAQNIFALRKTLCSTEEGRKYIETVPKVGYRFVGEVREILTDSPEVLLNEQIKARIVIEEEIENGKPIRILGSRKNVLSVLYSRNALTILVVFLTTSLAAFTFLHRRSLRTDGAGFKMKRIAVLPFKPLGSDNGNEFLELGMADALINRINHSQDLTVLPTSAIFNLGGRNHDPVEVGRQLEVDAVLDGTVERVGERVRVTAQLIRVSNGQLLWSGNFDERFADIFSLQDAFSRHMSEALSLHMSSHERYPRIKQPTSDTEAYQAYLMGVYFWNQRTKVNIAKAIDYLEQAVNKDPNFALAHAVLADSYYVCVDNNWNVLPLRDAYLKADAHAARALELDDGIAEAHTVKAGLLRIYRNYDGAEQEFRRALELNPDYAVAHLRYGYLLFGDLKLDEALRQMVRARELDPVSPTANMAVGYMRVMSRDYDEAITYYKKALEFQPDMVAAHINLGEVYTQKRRFEEARSEFDKIKDAAPLAFLSEMITLDGLSGRQEEALHLLSQLTKSSDHDRICPYQYTAIYAALNDKDAAFAWLEKISADRVNLAQVRFDPEFDTLRNDPRFADWVKRHQE